MVATFLNAKSLIAAAALATTVALGTAAPAQADPQIGFSFGITSGGFAPGFGPGYGHEPRPMYGMMESGFDGGPDPFFFQHHHRHHGWGYAAPVSYGISCGTGVNVVRANGFRGVQPVNCAAPVYSYQAWKHGDMFRVSVTTSGRIVAVNPLY